VVADGVGGELDRLPARQPGIARAGRQVGTQREVQLATGRAAAHPDQPEIADARAAGDGLALEVDDVVPTAAGFQCVHHPEHAAPDHHHPFHLSRPS
jgi:hypothetical protein